MKKITLLLWLFSLTFLARAGDPETEVRAMMSAQTAAWNNGDVRAFMSSYWHSEQLRFGSGNTISYGFAPTEKRFLERYNTPEKMGRLTFDILELMVFDQHTVQVFGRWSLQRQDDKPNGLFTLNVKQIDDKWQIVSDHTSSE